MQNFFRLSKRLTAKFLLTFAAVCLLAACSNPEKTDVIAITKVFSNSSYTPESQQKFQQRLMVAKSEAEQMAIIKEMAGKLEQSATDLDNLSLKSNEGRSARDHLAKGLKGIAVGTRKAMENANADEKTKMAIAMELSEAQKEMMQGHAEVLALAKKHNLDTDTSK